VNSYEQLQSYTTTAALASGQALRHVQDRYTNASDLTKNVVLPILLTW